MIVTGGEPVVARGDLGAAQGQVAVEADAVGQRSEVAVDGQGSAVVLVLVESKEPQLQRAAGPVVASPGSREVITPPARAGPPAVVLVPGGADAPAAIRGGASRGEARAA